MGSYGTGAVKVPAHDERDYAFSKAFGLPIIQVITAPEGFDIQEVAWTEGGKGMNLGQFDGLDVPTFKSKIMDWLEENGKGTRKVNYKFA